MPAPQRIGPLERFAWLFAALAVISGFFAIGLSVALVWKSALDDIAHSSEAAALGIAALVAGAVCAIGGAVTWWGFRGPDDRRGDPQFGTDLAARLIEAGHTQEATILLRTVLRADAGDERRARELLVELNRQSSRPDQAARWGLPIDGLTTPAERRAYVRAVGGLPSVGRLEDLSLSWGRPLSSDTLDVLRRAGWRSGDPHPATTGESRFERPSRPRALRMTYTVAFALFAVALIVAATLSAFSSPVAAPLARVLIASIGIIGGPMLVCEAVLERRGSGSRVLLSLGIVVGIGLTAGGVFLASTALTGWS